MSVSNLPPKHRFLQKYSNEVNARPLQPKANLPQGAKIAASYLIHENGERGISGSPALTLKRLYSASLEIQRRNSVSPMTPASPSDDLNEYYSYSFGKHNSGPIIPSTSSMPSVHSSHLYYQDNSSLQSASITPATPSSPLNRSTISNESQLNSESDTSSEDKAVEEQPHCCLLGCHKPVNNRLRHSLKTYTVKDCDPEFVSKKYDKVCNFHYFRDNYLYRKQQGKSVSNHDDLNKENIDDLNESKSDFEVKETLKRKRDTEPFIPVKKQSKNQEEEN